MQIAIDGPAGSGKSSVAQGIARCLGLKYLDTGAMYRAITLKALQEDLNLNDNQALVNLVYNCKMDIRESGQYGNLIYLDGKDVSAALRSPEVNQNVSIVAKSPALREALVSLQRKIAKKSGGIVMEGRDIGTNVITDAEFKFFLFADLKERAYRRWLEIKDTNNEVPLKDLLRQIARRDQLDQEREDAPLKAAPDAIIIDTTALTLQEVINKVLHFINNKEKSIGRGHKNNGDEGC